MNDEAGSGDRFGLLTEDELLIISNSLGQVLSGPYAVPDWEFPLIIGVSREETEVVHTRIAAEFDRRFGRRPRVPWVPWVPEATAGRPQVRPENASGGVGPSPTT